MTLFYITENVASNHIYICFQGIDLSNFNIYKNGKKMKTNDNVHVDITDDVISLLVDKVSVDDEATYAVRIEGSEKDLGEVALTVVSSVEKQR